MIATEEKAKAGPATDPSQPSQEGILAELTSGCVYKGLKKPSHVTKQALARVGPAEDPERPSRTADTPERDEEMEDRLAHGVSSDPLAAYDVDVQAEGLAIQQYLALLDADSGS